MACKRVGFGVLRLCAALGNMGFEQDSLAHGARHVSKDAAVIGGAVPGASLGLFDGGGRAGDGHGDRPGTYTATRIYLRDAAGNQTIVTDAGQISTLFGGQPTVTLTD